MSGDLDLTEAIEAAATEVLKDLSGRRPYRVVAAKVVAACLPLVEAQVRARIAADTGERLRRAVVRLQERHDSPGTGPSERARLEGKIEGVKLAASYMEEESRIFPPTPRCDAP